jgi:hypothetical protein
MGRSLRTVAMRIQCGNSTRAIAFPALGRGRYSLLRLFLVRRKAWYLVPAFISMVTRKWAYVAHFIDTRPPSR